MTAQKVTLRLPGPIYERLKHRADEARRTVEAEILDMVTAAVPVGDELPPGLEDTLAELPAQSDEVLWLSARSHLSPVAVRALARLNDKQQRDGLSAAESAKQLDLLRQYEAAILVRARAALLLKRRGHDISVLLNQEG